MVLVGFRFDFIAAYSECKASIFLLRHCNDPIVHFPFSTEIAGFTSGECSHGVCRIVTQSRLDRTFEILFTIFCAKTQKINIDDLSRVAKLQHLGNPVVGVVDFSGSMRRWEDCRSAQGVNLLV